MIEITVKVSNEEQTLTQKYLHYQEDPMACLVVSHDDPDLKKMVEDTVAKFKGAVEDTIVKLKYVW